MPLAYREGYGNIGYACYFFPDALACTTNTETYLWLRKTAWGEHLCAICGQLDFRFLFSHLLAETQVPPPADDPEREVTLFDGIHLGTIRQMRAKADCLFCCLVLAALDEGHPNGRAPSEIYGEAVSCILMNFTFGFRGIRTMSPFQPSAVEDGFPRAIQLRPRLHTRAAMVGGEDKDDHPSVNASDQEPRLIQVVTDERNELERPCVGKYVARVADFSQILGWLASCENTTRLKGMEDPKSGISTLLIDTERNCLVGPLCNTPYVALSYVWGNALQLMCKMDNVAALRQENSLSLDNNGIPRTIRDAILLCKKLRRPYLWVDSLCIIQDGPTKIELINRMNDIYQDAEFTIVAAAGDNANVGLPGLTTTERIVKQKTITVDDLVLAMAMATLDSVVRPSPWNGRGWTFQERFFSRTKLIFTDEQLYLDCMHGEMSENVHLNIHSYKPDRPDDSSFSEHSKYRIDVPGKANLGTYSEIVGRYTTRILTYPQDILNAFAGVSTAMSRRLFDRSPIICGIPLSILDIGLLWHPASRLGQRRTGEADTIFGSWSWAGWVGGVCYPSTQNVSDTTISRVEWLNASKLREGVIESLPLETTGKPPENWPGWAGWTRIASERNLLEYARADDLDGARFCHPIQPPIGPGIPLMPMNPTTGHLHFLAETAMLTVSGEHSQSLFADSRCEKDDHHVCHLVVLDPDGHQAGVVIVDGNTRARLTPGPHTFIKLSQRTFSSSSDDPAWDDDTKSFSGVPGEPGLQKFVQYGPSEDLFDEDIYAIDICWPVYNVLMVECKEKVWYRTGIGRVHIHAFDQAKMERRRIDLG
ncbi:heterokaryon incompatibility protein-domain-containing protein [Lasiosphaeria hispida]|uniref:Heterokaryon incompatibility protein-domain-containing protein n=1 Tax=Lasiosphaeria hispida TaxID=260671 RepID=A0AAJ0HP50_9PEZI|nr:heterokaryon incompatibility protein-domain-containing protein [Lasiosphaeria hispida]